MGWLYDRRKRNNIFEFSDVLLYGEIFLFYFEKVFKTK